MRIPGGYHAIQKLNFRPYDLPIHKSSTFQLHGYRAQRKYRVTAPPIVFDFKIKLKQTINVIRDSIENFRELVQTFVSGNVQPHSDPNYA